MRNKAGSAGLFYGIAVFIALIIMAAGLFFGVYVDSTLLHNNPEANYRQILPILALLFLFLLQMTGGYLIGRRRLFHVVYALFIAITLTNLGLMALPFLDISYEISKIAVLVTACTQFFLFCLWAYMFHRVYYAVFPKRRALILADTLDNARFCAEKVRTHSREFTPSKTAVYNYESVAGYDAVIAYRLPPDALAALGEICALGSQQLCVVPGLWELGIHKSKEIQFGDMMAFSVNPLGLSKEQELLKRFTDIILSFLASAVTLPVILILALLVFLRDGHRPFFTQERLTKGGRTFKVIKLRTMIWGAETHTGPILASSNDIRITSIGRFLRRTRLDELPQFWNVLRGDMSIVGPRPERTHFTELYAQSVPHFRARLTVKAGLTGMAHVNGRYDTPPEERIKLDLYYIFNYSYLLDIKIMIETARIMLSQSYAEGVKGGGRPDVAVDESDQSISSDKISATEEDVRTAPLS